MTPVSMNVIQADVGVAGIHAFTTLRAKGTSDAPFQSLNFGDHVGDDPQKVKFNRDILRDSLPGNVPPRWLQQIHGVDVVAAHSLAEGEVPVADAIWTDRPGMAVAVMTADCLPIVLAGLHSDWVAIVHAGWRGLAAGVIEATLAAVPGSFEGARAWFGPAIGPCCFEVGAEVRATFLERFGATVTGCFSSADSSGKYLADLAGMAALRLHDLGINKVSHSGRCTACESQNFFSHRRDGITGRMATVGMILPQ